MKRKKKWGAMRGLLSGLILTILAGSNATGQTLQWERFWGGTGNDNGKGIFIFGRDIYVSGYTSSFGAGGNDALLLKYDLSGNEVWTRTWGGSNSEDARGIHVLDNNIYLPGRVKNGGERALALKYNSLGNLLWYRIWDKTWGYRGWEHYFDVFAVGNGVYITGTSEFGWCNGRLLLHKYDTSGNLIWDRYWGPIRTRVNTGGRGIIVSDNHIYIVGYVGDPSLQVPGQYAPEDAFVQKYDASGNLIWSRTWGGTGVDGAMGIAIAGNDIYVVGYTYSSGAGGDIFILRYDTDGNLIWSQTCGGTGKDTGTDIFIANNYLYISGLTESFGANAQDALLLKFDFSGNPVWYETWGGANNEVAYELFVLGNDIYVVGYTNSFGAGNNDVFLLKYLEVIEATVDIDPDTLNLKSKGKWVTCYIGLPEEYDVNEIDINTVELEYENQKISADRREIQGNIFMVKFSRPALIYILGGMTGSVELKVHGKVSDTPFEGMDTIRVK